MQNSHWPVNGKFRTQVVIDWSMIIFCDKPTVMPQMQHIWVFEYLSIYLWKLQLLQEGWATSLGTYWSKKWRSCCSVRAGHDLTYYPTNSINRNRLHWGHKGQDIANDYIIKLEVSAFRFHLKYALVLRYLVTSDGVKGTTYSRAQKQSLWECGKRVQSRGGKWERVRKVRNGTSTGCKLLNKGCHTIITGINCKLLNKR